VTNGKNVFPLEVFQELRLLECEMILFAGSFVDLCLSLCPRWRWQWFLLFQEFSVRSQGPAVLVTVQALWVHVEEDKGNNVALFLTKINKIPSLCSVNE